MTDPSARKTLTVTAAAMFVAGALASWGVGHLADKTLQATSAEITVQASPGGGPAFSVVVPPVTDLGAVDVPYSGDVIASWASNQGGGPADTATTTVNVWASVDHPVRISGIRADGVQCEVAPAWDYVEPVGGGDIFKRSVLINLDSGDRNAVGIEDQLTGDVFSFPLQVSRDDAEYFQVYVHVEHSICDYELSVGYETDGGVRWQKLPGPPRRVVSSASRVRTLSWVEDSMDSGKVHLELTPP